MPQLDVTTYGSQIFWLLVHFTVLYLVMARVALPKVARLLESLEDRINDDLQKARDLQREAERVEAEYRQAQRKARLEAKGIIDTLKAEVSKDINERQQALQQRLLARAAEADATIATTRQRALGEMRAVAAELAEASYQRLTGTAPTATEVEAALRNVGPLPAQEAA